MPATLTSPGRLLARVEADVSPCCRTAKPSPDSLDLPQAAAATKVAHPVEVLVVALVDQVLAADLLEVVVKFSSTTSVQSYLIRHESQNPKVADK